MKKKLFITLILITTMTLFSCDQHSKPGPVHRPGGTFGFDRAFIFRHDAGAVELADGDARLVISPKYQGKVFTSTAGGDTGRSLGWINYKAFDGPPGVHMNAYGGENRLWLGPEGGPMSLFFRKGAKQVFENWHVPAAFDSEAWNLVGTRLAGTEATLSKDMELENYAGQRFKLKVTRTIRLLEKNEMERLLHVQVTKSMKAVAYRTENTITNTGAKAWNDKDGTFCTWMLDMFPPSPRTVIVVPFKPGPGNPATTDYFGEIPGDRLRISGNVLYFKADGKSRGKLGIHPVRARDIAGSYDAEHRVLTIIQFNVENNPVYLNQEWRLDKPLLSGDAVNAYNDGPLADGSQLGPFYELESVSSAHYCAPDGSSTHWHTVYHFSGTEKELDYLCRNLLGVSLAEINKAFSYDEETVLS